MCGFVLLSLLFHVRREPKLEKKNYNEKENPFQSGAYQRAKQRISLCIRGTSEHENIKWHYDSLPFRQAKQPITIVD